jgi:hypothetical protein
VGTERFSQMVVSLGKTLQVELAVFLTLVVQD